MPQIAPPPLDRRSFKNSLAQSRMARKGAIVDYEGDTADRRSIPSRRINGLMPFVGVDGNACRSLDMCSILGRSKHRKILHRALSQPIAGAVTQFSRQRIVLIGGCGSFLGLHAVAHDPIWCVVRPHLPTPHLWAILVSKSLEFLGSE